MKTMRSVGSGILFVGVVGFIVSGVMAQPAVAQLSALLSQGVTITQTVTGSGMMGKGASTSTVTLYFSGNAMKQVNADGTDSIIRFDQGKIISVDNKKKTYSEVTFQQLQDEINKALSEAKMDPEQMAMIKKMTGQTATQFSVTDQGPGEIIAGYKTEKYLVAGPMEMQIFAAPDLRVPSAYFDSLRIKAPANPMFDMGKMYDELKKINGWPMKNVTTMRMMNMSMTTTTEVTSVVKGAVPPSTFEVPAGYKLVK